MSTGIDPQAFADAVVDSSPVAAENLATSISNQSNGFTPVTNSTGAYTTTTVTPTTSTSLIFTQAEIEKAREQEKSKLYPQIESLKSEIETLKREKEEREAEEARKRAEAEAEAERLREEEMSVRELLDKREQEWNERLEAERRERETAIALLDRERQFQELQAWKVARVEQERDNIMPELLDLVEGSSPEEIEASIASLRDRSQRILESAQAAMTATRRDMVGTRTTVPASGPLDTNSDNRQFTPEDIQNMSLSEYQKYRSKLLGSGASSSGRGLFG